MCADSTVHSQHNTDLQIGTGLFVFQTAQQGKIRCCRTFTYKCLYLEKSSFLMLVLLGFA